MNRNGFDIRLNGKHILGYVCAACLTGETVCDCGGKAYEDYAHLQKRGSLFYRARRGLEVWRGDVCLRTHNAAKVSEVPGRMRGAIGRRAA